MPYVHEIDLALEDEHVETHGERTPEANALLVVPVHDHAVLARHDVQLEVAETTLSKHKREDMNRNICKTTVTQLKKTNDGASRPKSFGNKN